MTVAESVYVAAITGLGGALLLSLRPRLPLGFVAAAAFPIGLALQAVGAWALLIARLPLVPVTVIGAPAAVVGVALWRGRRHLQVDRSGATLLGALCALAFAVSWAAQWLRLTTLSSDSFVMLELASMLRDRPVGEVDAALLLTRPVFVPLSQVLRHDLGAHFLPSVFVLIGLSGLACLACIASRLLAAACVPGRIRTALVGAAVAAIGSTHFFVWQLFYVNGHLIVATYLLLLVGGVWLGARTGEWAWAMPSGLAIPAVLLARLESPLVLALFLVPLLCASEVPYRVKAMLTGCFVVPVVAWYGGVLAVQDTQGRILSTETVLLMLLLAAALVALLGLVRVRRLDSLVQRAPGLMLGAVGTALLYMFATKPAEMQQNVVTIATNVLLTGQWGATLAVVGVLLLLVLLARPAPSDRLLTVPLVSYPLLVLGLAYMEHPYRAAWADSGNRMLTHVLFVAVLYVVMRAGAAVADSDDGDLGPTADGERAVGEERTLARIPWTG